MCRAGTDKPLWDLGSSHDQQSSVPAACRECISGVEGLEGSVATF